MLLSAHKSLQWPNIIAWLYPAQQIAEHHLTSVAGHNCLESRVSNRVVQPKLRWMIAWCRGNFFFIKPISWTSGEGLAMLQRNDATQLELIISEPPSLRREPVSVE
jgi:hypothetical protein